MKRYGNALIHKGYGRLIEFMKAYMPRTRAKLAYYVAYREKCNLDEPKTFSEKLLWLSLNTYRNNPLILRLSDKYLVREYISNKGYEDILNTLHYVWNKKENIDFEILPPKFVLKMSQGCQTNILCPDKMKLDINKSVSIIKKWDSNQYLYDKMMADIGGISVNDMKKYYICEEYLEQENQKELVDYKIYCFNGEPKAILVIGDRFDQKKGAFMSMDWDYISDLKGQYRRSESVFEKPKSLKKMIEVSKTLSAEFPFVRVDLYDINGRVVFGELTFFPNGCIKMQETKLEGKSMGELLDISKEQNEVSNRGNTNDK